MVDFTNQTAVLIFARSANKEAISKIISPYKKQNLQFWNFCNKNITQTVEKSGLPYFISDEKTQGRGTFGQKLSAAVQSVFEKGFANVIVVGNDCLSLKSKHITKAYDSLKNGVPATGCDNHGGAYIITLSRNIFDSKTFENIPWQTSKVYDGIASYNKNEFLALEKLCDLNSRKAFLLALKTDNIPTELLPFLKLIVGSISDDFNIDQYFSTRFKSASNFNKGSPVGFFL